MGLPRLRKMGSHGFASFSDPGWLCVLSSDHVRDEKAPAEAMETQLPEDHGLGHRRSSKETLRFLVHEKHESMKIEGGKLHVVLSDRGKGIIPRERQNYTLDQHLSALQANASRISKEPRTQHSER